MSPYRMQLIVDKEGREARVQLRAREQGKVALVECQVLQHHVVIVQTRHFLHNRGSQTNGSIIEGLGFRV